VSLDGFQTIVKAKDPANQVFLVAGVGFDIIPRWGPTTSGLLMGHLISERFFLRYAIWGYPKGRWFDRAGQFSVTTIEDYICNFRVPCRALKFFEQPDLQLIANLKWTTFSRHFALCWVVISMGLSKMKKLDICFLQGKY
jgi:hypothetical protein